METMSTAITTSESAAASADPDTDATVREFIDYTEYLPSDIYRYLFRIRDLNGHHDAARIQLDDALKTLSPLRATSSATPTDKELELRLLVSRFLNDASQSCKEGAVEAARLQDHVDRHHSRIVAIHDKLDAITLPSRDPTPEEKRPRPQKPDPTNLRITLRVNPTDPTPPSRRRPTHTRTPARRPTPDEASDDDDATDDGEDGWIDEPATPFTADPAPKPARRSKKSFGVKRAPKLPPSDPMLTGGAPSKFPDGTPIPNHQLPWNQLTNEELARLRKRMKKNSAWTPSVTMIVRELEALGRGPNNKDLFRDQWEEKGESYIGPEQGGIGDPHKILPDDASGSRENKGMRLNRAKKRKREEEKKERAREAERSGIDPIENERRVQEEEKERQQKEQQAKRKKKKEEEEARLAKEKAESEAHEAAQREKHEREAAQAAAQAAAAQAAQAAAAAAAAQAERETHEREAREKAAAQKAAAAAAAEAAAAASAPSAPLDSDDDLSDVPDIDPPPPKRTSKRNSVRPPSRPPRSTSLKRASAVASSPPPPKRSASITPAHSLSGKKPAGKRPSGSGGGRRRKRGAGGDVVNAGDESEEDLNLYCVCDQVSRGTMVACENDECQKVWFHISCVNLTKEQVEKEELKWYCPLCEGLQGRPRAGKRRRKN